MEHNYYDDVMLGRARLSREQTLELWKEYKQTGDIDIKKRIFAGNIGLVKNAVRVYGYIDFNDVEREDLVQYAAMFTWKYLDHFDPNSGEFSTYVTTCAANGIKRYFHKPHIDTVSLDKGIKISKEREEEYKTLADMLPAKDDTEAEAIKNVDYDHIAYIIAPSVLDIDELLIFNWRFGEEMQTLEQIAKTLGITKEGVRLQEIKILNKIRNALNKVDMQGKQQPGRYRGQRRGRFVRLYGQKKVLQICDAISERYSPLAGKISKEYFVDKMTMIDIAKENGLPAVKTQKIVKKCFDVFERYDKKKVAQIMAKNQKGTSDRVR